MEIGFRRADRAGLLPEPWTGAEEVRGILREEKIALRFTQIKAAASLDVLCKVPQARCHQLVADRSEQFSLDLEHPLRMIVEVADAPVPRVADGGIDRTQVRRLAFVEITDTH